jgi:hypothetical protein
MSLLAYFGPETTLPVASSVAAVVGFALMSWRLVAARIKGIFRIGPSE